MSRLAQIDLGEWQERFLALDPAEVAKVRYFRHLPDRAFTHYLKPPSSFLPYGMRRLSRLRYDPDPRALRLWAFALEETERVFRGRQAGMRVVGLMGDYGATAALVFGLRDVVAFYPDFCYWTPFLMESDVLLERADRRGLGEDTCFVRAAVGAFTSGAWWPDPDVVLAASGASCDDLSAVAQVAADAGTRMIYTEIPLRKEPGAGLTATRFETDPDLPDAPPTAEGAVERTTATLRDALHRVARALGQSVDEKRLFQSVARARRIRLAVRRIRDLIAVAPVTPLPACEALLLEFASVHFYGDPEECEAVVDGVRTLVEERVGAGDGFGDGDELRVVWATPPPDPLLHTLIESAGARVVGTEYLIGSALTPVPEDEPVRAVARAFLAGSLLGGPLARAATVVRETIRSRAEGVVVANLFGSSHCGSEAPVIRRAVEDQVGVPVLSFDVPKPSSGDVPSQTRNRIEAFLEALRARRRR